MRAISVPWKKQGQEQVRGEGLAAEAGKAGGIWTVSVWGYSGVKSSAANNREINTEQDTEDLEPATFFRGGMCCSVGEGDIQG